MKTIRQITEHLLSAQSVLNNVSVLVIVVIIILVKPTGAMVI